MATLASGTRRRVSFHSLPAEIKLKILHLAATELVPTDSYEAFLELVHAFDSSSFQAAIKDLVKARFSDESRIFTADYIKALGGVNRAACMHDTASMVYYPRSWRISHDQFTNLLRTGQIDKEYGEYLWFCFLFEVTSDLKDFLRAASEQCRGFLGMREIRDVETKAALVFWAFAQIRDGYVGFQFLSTLSSDEVNGMLDMIDQIAFNYCRRILMDPELSSDLLYTKAGNSPIYYEEFVRSGALHTSLMHYMMQLDVIELANLFKFELRLEGGNVDDLRSLMPDPVYAIKREVRPLHVESEGDKIILSPERGLYYYSKEEFVNQNRYWVWLKCRTDQSRGSGMKGIVRPSIDMSRLDGLTGDPGTFVFSKLNDLYPPQNVQDGLNNDAIDERGASVEHPETKEWPRKTQISS